MTTDFTVVGKVRNSDAISELIAAIRAKGKSCYSFLEKTHLPETAPKDFQTYMDYLESHPDFWNDPEHHEHFKTDLKGLKNAETVIALAPFGNATHIECGIAFGLGKKLILVGEVEKPETLYLIFEERYPDIESFLATI